MVLRAAEWGSGFYFMCGYCAKQSFQSALWICSDSNLSACEWNLTSSAEERRFPFPISGECVYIDRSWKNAFDLMCRSSPTVSPSPGFSFKVPNVKVHRWLFARMMYTITRGPSKLVTQRRTGETHIPLQIDHTSHLDRWKIDFHFHLFSRAYSAAGEQNKRFQAQTNVMEYAWVSVLTFWWDV